MNFIIFFCHTVHIDIHSFIHSLYFPYIHIQAKYQGCGNYKYHTPTNALFIKLDKVLKFTLKITLTCSYMFRSTTIVR